MDTQRWKRVRLAVLASLISVGGNAFAGGDEKSKPAEKAKPATAPDSSNKNKVLARQLFELGIEEYKAKDFEAAAMSMDKSYALDPQPDTLYALAQSERLSNKCEPALRHYQLLLDQTSDEKTKTVVKGQLEMCEQILRGEKPKEVATVDAVEHRDAPTIQIRTVYRTEQKSNKLAITLFTIGGISLGGAATTYLLSRSTRSDANNATSLDGFNDLYDRSQLLKHISWGAAGVGLVAVGWATFRVIRGGGAKKERNLAMVPTRGGSMVTFATSF